MTTLEGSPLLLAERFAAIRALTRSLAAPLSIEDRQVQSMRDTSPTKWHLAHTSWFFETFVTLPYLPGERPFHPAFGRLFNSYYDAVGERHARPDRGLLSRPSSDEVDAYRDHVDARARALLASRAPEGALEALELGLHHEQQHQELLLTDAKHLLGSNPLLPAYLPRSDDSPGAPAPRSWLSYAEGVRTIGYSGEGFCFDNESPSHRAFLNRFDIASRPVLNCEFLEFMSDGGYGRPDHWHSDGWSEVRERGLAAPLYWHDRDGAWWTYTLGGARPVVPAEPVCHLSWFEASAFARWAGARLPTEAEWEVAAGEWAPGGALLESGRIHPSAVTQIGPRFFGDVWEWTSSAYLPYPGFRPLPGAFGEYNAKFMCNQFVLRGGSCATPRTHLRKTYRNFFPPSARWQFSGLRLARDGY